MGIKMYVLGGIDEAGRNMTAYEFDDSIVICDMGLQLSNLILYNDEVSGMNLDEMVEKEIVANPKMLLEKKEKVKAIVISHAHLDHVGAIQYMANLFNCPIYATPFTIEVLKILMKSRQSKNIFHMKNKFIKLNVNSKIDIGSNTILEFINVTHSTPQSVAVAIHTPNDGVILYAMDFKFDNRPALGQRPNYKKFEELGKSKNVKLAVIDSLRSNKKKKTLSEIVVKEMLRDVFIETDISDINGIIITTFASHITRLKSIVELTAELGRKCIFMGRSMTKYTQAAKNAGIIDFKENGVIICETVQEVNKWLSIVNKNKKKYVIICTGHQGELNAVMSKIAEDRTPYKLKKDDIIVFSSEIIPTAVNIEQSQVLANKLDNYECKVLRDIHVSGHGGQDDLKKLIELTQPKHIVPGHGQLELKEGMVELCQKMGYKEGKTLHILEDQKSYNFD
jgi:ribonuclease J